LQHLPTYHNPSGPEEPNLSSAPPRSLPTHTATRHSPFTANYFSLLIILVNILVQINYFNLILNFAPQQIPPPITGRWQNLLIHGEIKSHHLVLPYTFLLQEYRVLLYSSSYSKHCTVFFKANATCAWEYPFISNNWVTTYRTAKMLFYGIGYSSDKDKQKMHYNSGNEHQHNFSNKCYENKLNKRISTRR
jgi:hypothetical protein